MFVEYENERVKEKLSKNNGVSEIVSELHLDKLKIKRIRSRYFKKKTTQLRNI